MKRTRSAASAMEVRPERARGFTVIELMIVLTITALLLALATPNLRGLLARNQLLGQANEMAAALSLARSEAVTRGVQAGVCLSDDGTSCRAGALTGGNWQGSLLVFVDEDNSSSFENTELLLRSLSATGDLGWDTAATEFYFTPSGFSTIALNESTICHEDLDENDRCRRITVQPSGIVSVTRFISP